MSTQNINNIQNKFQTNDLSYKIKPAYTEQLPAQTLDQNNSVADKFIKETQKFSKENKQGSWYSRNCCFPTLNIPIVGGILAYSIHSINKIKKLDKLGNKKMAKKSALKMVKTLPLISAVGFGVILTLGKLFNAQTNKNYEEVKKYFNSVNKTHAKLAAETFNSTSTGAYYSPANGEIAINNIQINDPYSRIQTKALIKHELVHAKQYELIARSKDGIKKINYICLKNVIPMLKNDLKTANDFERIYNEIQNDKTGKYDNILLTLPDAKVHFKNYITAIHILYNNENATYNDIPTFINEKHYQEVIQKEGNISETEEVKANKYYNAAINYTIPTSKNMFNPFSDYHNNLLEKEAYKEIPWYARIL